MKVSRLHSLLWVLVAFFFVAVQRLPAPIVEQTTNPTPAPEEQQTRSRPKHSKTTHKESQSTTPKAQPTPSPSRFAGVWNGTLNLGIFGNAETTFTTNSAGTRATEKNKFGQATHNATCDGTVMKWRSGALGEIAETLTPGPDGQTAIVTANSLFISNPSVTFRKQPNSESVADQSLGTQPQASIPTAKAVPDRPGFVYDPFDQNSKTLLDVRGRPSGTKVKDPAGRLFVVP